MGISEIKKKIEEQSKVQDAIAEFLEEGVDYYILDNVSQNGETVSTKVLKKAGAELLVKLFGLTVETELLSEVYNKSSVATISCKAYLKKDGVIVGDSYGAAFLGYYNYDRNIGYKVAKNRAVVAAITSYSGVARVFSEEPTGENAESETPDKKEKLIQILMVKAKEKKISEKLLLKRFGLTSMVELHSDQVQVLIDMLDSNIPKAS